MKKSKTMMRARMTMYQQIRDFFNVLGVDEVETPILSHYGGTDLHIDSLATCWQEQICYLHTSPEFAMKKLLSDGFGDCFQIAKVFRDEQASRTHRPEFILLEWYRLGFELPDLIDEVYALAKKILNVNAALPKEILSYADAFTSIGINPHSDDLDKLKQQTEKLSGYLPNLSDQRDEWLDFLLVTQLEPKLGRGKLTFITHYPESMASLAKKSQDAQGNVVAERFELYYKGIELANGFNELTDAKEQLARFLADNVARKQLNKPEMPVDTALIAALEKGMPSCSGVAVGLDRILMLSQGYMDIDDVMPLSVQ